MEPSSMFIASWGITTIFTCERREETLGKSLTKEEILRYCEKLPKYKRRRKVFLGEVPSNPTGKIEKTERRTRYIGREGAFKV
jgi:acyl-CoA synthetase (AMP-forming)/AMP-acid ligase II